jgi:uncharacterized protein YndB with AHSA1/START domain
MPTPTTPIEVDLRVGGTWKQQMIVNEDLSYPTGGIYLEIVPDERLVFRWGAVGGWPELDGEKELTAPVVTVQLSDLGTKTQLVLTVQFSEYLDIEEVQELRHGGMQEGWGTTIDRVKDSSAMTIVTNGRMAGPEKLSADGSVLDPLSPKPWGASDGQVIDRHGLHWLVGYEPAP